MLEPLGSNLGNCVILVRLAGRDAGQLHWITVTK
jgi:hypothetical protein